MHSTLLYRPTAERCWLEFSGAPHQVLRCTEKFERAIGKLAPLRVLTGLQGSTAASRMPCAPLNPAGGGGRQLAGATMGPRRSHASNTAAAPGPVFEMRIWHNQSFFKGCMHTFLLVDSEQVLAN